ncbi:Beta-adaptin-like protein A [Phytophthora fragariae]|uniref:AP complex subunit beta n=1 Tax=Phytophthora fragariae TaxID=53985 RepID=A0A6A4DED2_9STRA|nr:Beta-adaptin-like protein A [Phytophthora fragariae]KAE8934846.1 Beta-adaptin-like protein A [Phytophthora fragariae]KAE9104111.1 Beta-adaptin-like protein A [Phytophthora fragariae]KAE9141806.1 Beta-adaptin-like protein A [Phytophthora fragariae]KAE9204335.1 Beta-adaptin-like protein A [Phytophthora fragariae]
MFPSMAGLNPSYPSQGPPPGGMAPPAPSGAPGTQRPAGGSNPSYFTDKKKGEVNELKNLLREVTVEKDVKRKREIIKKVIAYMTLGIDVSRLFSEMVLCVDTKDLISKKMVYLYLTNYAQKNSELAIMCINTLLNDCRNEDPMVRGLALRSLCSLRLDSILEYIHDPLQSSLTDTSAYVRKTGVIGILKVYSLNPEIIKESDMIDTLYNMIRDRDPQVVSNCLVALNEIMADEGGIAINQPIVMHLLSRITDFNEWGQCNILEIVAKYKPTGPDEVFTIMNTLEQCLRVSNSAVVLATAKCFFNLTQTRGMEQIQDQVHERMRQPLLTLMAGGSHEINYCVLHHILLLVGKKPHIFSRDYRQFYNRYNEPTHVKYVKIDILALVADGANVADIVTELSEYVTDVDQELARRAIRAIADIAVSPNLSVNTVPQQYPGGGNVPEAYGQQAAEQLVEQMQDHIMDTMVDFLELDLDYVRDESLVVMKDLLRKYPEKRHDVLPVLARIIASVEQPAAKAAVVWMVGEFGQDLRRAPYVLEKLIDEFNDEAAPSVLLELLAATMKLFFKRPPEVQSMLGRLLGSAINESNHQDVRDRALLYYRLLEQQPTEQAAAIVAQFRTEETVSVFAESIETDLKDKLFQEFNSLAVVYNKPSELFVSSSRLAGTVAPLEDEEDEEDDDEAESYNNGAPQQQQQHQPPQQQQQRQSAPPPQPAAPSMDLLDMDFGSASSGPPPQAANPAFALVPTPVMDAPTFQGHWGSRPVVAEVVVQLPTLPPQSELEQAFASRGIVTMASGDVGPQYKFFFYAQDTQGRYFLSETLVDKASSTLRATIKGEDEASGSQFAEVMRRILFG